MKIGSDADRDPTRIAAAKQAIGTAGLFVDANGAYGLKQAQDFGKRFTAEQDVRWFEGPVSSDDLNGLRRLRDHIPAPMEIAAGEYGYTTDYFRTMLEAGAVDVLQADATRCGGGSPGSCLRQDCAKHFMLIFCPLCPRSASASWVCCATVPTPGMVSRPCHLPPIQWPVGAVAQGACARYG
jgi:L-alanine-DL-glutamate epimerase-like enolase superfamily enzyme